jgi:hypothetical protein
MIAANTLWVAVVVIVVVYVVARWVRSNTATEEEQNEQVRYLIQAPGGGTAQHLGAKEGLLVSRYYFRDTDIETGPPDPADFYDELFVDLRGASSDQTWQNSIHVATPRALDRVMVEEHWDSVIGTELLIVRRYDLDTILRAAVDHLQQIYEARVQLPRGIA